MPRYKTKEELVEFLAANAHEIWSASKIEAGWTYDPIRNNDLKHHPCLVPYNELPDSEKEYDRNVARSILNELERNGYVVVLSDKADTLIRSERNELGIYEATPIETKHVILDPNQSSIVETVAASMHNKWVESRLAEGKTLNDDPRLVPYEQLNENDKDANRVAVFENMKTIVAAGGEVTDKLSYVEIDKMNAAANDNGFGV